MDPHPKGTFVGAICLCKFSALKTCDFKLLLYRPKDTDLPSIHS